MQYLFRLLFSKLKKSYYYSEIRQLSKLAGIVLVGWVAYTYGSAIVQAAFSHTGMIYIAFFLLSVVLGLVIKLYYRIMVIKYGGEENRHIALLEEQH